MILNIKYRPASKSDLEFLLDLRIHTMNAHLTARSLPVSNEWHSQKNKRKKLEHGFNTRNNYSG